MARLVQAIWNIREVQFLKHSTCIMLLTDRQKNTGSTNAQNINFLQNTLMLQTDTVIQQCQWPTNSMTYDEGLCNVHLKRKVQSALHLKAWDQRRRFQGNGCDEVRSQDQCQISEYTTPVDADLALSQSSSYHLHIPQLHILTLTNTRLALRNDWVKTTQYLWNRMINETRD